MTRIEQRLERLRLRRDPDGIETSSSEYRVIKKLGGKTLFSGTPDECVDWIRRYDKNHKEYVDLRIMDPDNREWDYHKDPAPAEEPAPKEAPIQAVARVLHRLRRIDDDS